MPAYRDQSAEISAALGALPTGSAVSAVANRLLDLFTGGSIAPGTRLPPERQLAATLGVGRSAVREALAALEILGIVDVRPGSGTYLRGNASELLPQSLRWGMVIGERSTLELIEVRSGLEIFAARLAAERLDDDQLNRLGEHLERMRAGVGDLAAFVEADLAFHHLLATSTGNAVLLDLLQIVRSLLRIWVDRAVQDDEHAEAAVREHTAIYDALRQRDPDAAASAMAAHMATASARLAAIEPGPAS
ncbi:FadR/GntR family transcriptional regulator [Microlunatus sp. GCM10028923]|uniref:FadR/GntR family transcriptional regulator n=1 Tax=Microlunatus sp. GCM10028923 TaxID=3273400 RepID=UPI00360EA645